jgi:hypothetical protein
MPPRLIEGMQEDLQQVNKNRSQHVEDSMIERLQ